MNRQDAQPTTTTGVPKTPRAGYEAWIAAGLIAGCLARRSLVGRVTLLASLAGAVLRLWRSPALTSTQATGPFADCPPPIDTTQLATPADSLIPAEAWQETISESGAAQDLITTPEPPSSTEQAFADNEPASHGSAFVQPVIGLEAENEIAQPIPVEEASPVPPTVPVGTPTAQTAAPICDSAPPVLGTPLPVPPASVAPSAGWSLMLRDLTSPPQPMPAPTAEAQHPGASLVPLISKNDLTAAIATLTNASPPVPPPLPIPEPAPARPAARSRSEPSGAAWLLGLAPLPKIHEDPAEKTPSFAAPSAMGGINGGVIPDLAELPDLSPGVHPAVTQAFAKVDASPPMLPAQLTPPPALPPPQPAPTTPAGTTKGLLGKIFATSTRLGSPVRPVSTALSTPPSPTSEEALPADVVEEVLPVPLQRQFVAPAPANKPKLPASWIEAELRQARARTAAQTQPVAAAPVLPAAAAAVASSPLPAQAPEAQVAAAPAPEPAPLPTPSPLPARRVVPRAPATVPLVSPETKKGMLNWWK